jgi:transposase-like protein
MESRQGSRKYTPEYKLKVVMESFRSGKTVSRVASENDLSPSVLVQWRKEFMKKAPSIFYYKKVSRKSSHEKEFAADAYIKTIRELREMNNMSQYEVANYLGTSQTMYARYENGLSKMPIRHLMMLVKLYGVSADYILGISDHGRYDAELENEVDNGNGEDK